MGSHSVVYRLFNKSSRKIHTRHSRVHKGRVGCIENLVRPLQNICVQLRKIPKPLSDALSHTGNVLHICNAAQHYSRHALICCASLPDICAYAILRLGTTHQDQTPLHHTLEDTTGVLLDGQLRAALQTATQSTTALRESTHHRMQ